ncbi:MAG TPA: NADPH-dependent FMN reductase, partial [Reyranella sp.]|nr:NADPH-dependent FMN reductase [Reyranella sp.]
MARAKVRTGMPSVTLDKAEFARRVRRRFYDPAFKSAGQEIERIIEVAWDAYNDSRKSPITKPAGAGYADPTYELSVEWSQASKAIKQAER